MNIDYDTLLDGSDDDFEEESEIGTDDELTSELEKLEESEDEKNVPKSWEEELAENDYLKMIENKLQQGQLDDYTFMLEKLMIDYKQALKHRRFNIDDEQDLSKIERIRVLKTDLQQELIEEKIDEMDFTRKYYNLLRLEYDLLLKYEDYTLKSKKLKTKSEIIDKGIDELIKQEHKYLKKIAKEREIQFPEKPKINKKDSKIIKFQKYLLYHLELEKAYNITKEYIPGYKLRTIEPQSIGEDTNWIIIDSDKFLFEEIKKEYNESKNESGIFVDPNQEFKIQAIKKVLQNKTREELLNCITSENIINKLSYIETLRNNTIPVMKFREYPETYEKLQEILGEEAKYYKISTNDLMKDFNKSFFNVSSNIDLEKFPKTFQPTFFVKIKNSVIRTQLPKQFDEEQDDISKNYKIKESAKGYSFILKINKTKKQKNKRISEYTERGSVVGLSLKPEYFKSDKVPNGIISERYYNIVKPLPDNLYLELKSKNLSPLNTELTQVYELHIPIPELSASEDKTTKLVRRYDDFNDYLKDLLKILEANLISLENVNAVRSADILYTKIQKIKKYLETGIDPELEFSNKFSVKDLITQDEVIQKQRKIGTDKLKEYIFQFYPQNQQIIEVLENDIFEFNHKNYQYNIDKIIFIFREFSDSLENYINARVSFIELIAMELPLIKPEDDLKDIYIDPNKTFKYLYSWSPKIDYYLKYKEELEKINNDIIEFKRQKKDLSSLEINEIYDQMIEYNQWEQSKIKLRTVHIANKKDPVRVMIDFLKKERNKLMSRRIYRIATISERIFIREDLFRIFIKCNLVNHDKKDIITLTESIENIIYSLSTKPYLYHNYANLVKTEYKTLCDLITSPKSITPIITEFIIKEGNLKFINIERLNEILNVLSLQNENIEDNELLIQFLEKLRYKELVAYRASLLEQQNKEPTNYKLKLIKSINLVIEENKSKRKEEMYSIAINTYIAPVVTNIVPKVQNGPNKFYVPNYYIIGENEYLYGGNFPDFINVKTGERNYTDDDLYSLAVLLKIDYKEDIQIKQLYNECIQKLQNSSSLSKQVYTKQVILEYNPTLITKKIHTSFVNYIYRQRIGVKNPGEVYIVYQDTIKVSYAVPFKFNKFGIPVYSSKFLDPELKRFYYIEGPSEFERDDEGKNLIHSTMYILVEYKDNFGKIKLFREGVNHRNVKRTPKEKFDACNRFSNEIDCNDLNSYGIEKMKCKFIKGKCISVREQLKEQKVLINIPDVSFKRPIKRTDKSGKDILVTDYYKTKLWNDAVKKANNFIVQLMVIKNLTNQQIQDLALEQREKLTDYYKFLQQLNSKVKLERIIEDTNYSNLKELTEYLVEKEEPEIPEIPEIPEKEEPEIPEEIIKYNTIQLPKLITSNLKLSVKQLLVGNKYLLENNIVATLLSKSEKELEFTDGNNIIKFETGKQSVRLTTLNELVQNIYFSITKDDLELLKNPPSTFMYTLLENIYDFKKNEIVVKQKRSETNEIPLDILYLSYEELYNLPSSSTDTPLKEYVINRNMIYHAMAKVQHGIYEKNKNGFLESFDIFPATIEAKIHALKYSVDLLQLSKVIKDEIKLSDVINFYNKVLPKIKTVNQEIISQLEYGLLNKDIKLLKRYVKIAEKQLKNDNNESISRLVLDATSIIIEYDSKSKKQVKEETENEKEKDKEQKEKQKEEKVVKVSYVVQKRRKKRDD